MKQALLLKLKHFNSICKDVFIHFFNISGSLKAGALAYATLVSVVPLMVLSLGFILAFPAFAEYFQEIHRFLFRHLVPSSADTIQQYVESFALNATNLSAISLAFFLLTAVMLIFSIESVFNAIWKVKTRRRGLLAFLIYWAVLTLLPPLSGFAFAISLFLYSLPYISTIMQLFAIFVPFILSWAGFIFLYVSVPNCKVKFRHAAIGGFVAAVFFELIKSLFRIYVTKYSTDTAIYGVLAAIPGFLVWLYVTWLIIIFGAVIAFVLGNPRKTEQTVPELSK